MPASRLPPSPRLGDRAPISAPTPTPRWPPFTRSTGSIRPDGPPARLTPSLQRETLADILVNEYSLSGIKMQKHAHPANPLALAVLALLFERPMHPYEMAATLKQRHKEDSIKLRYGSLYTVIDLLVDRGFISARGVGRDGRRPERTVYEITAAGRDELGRWVAALIWV